MNEIHAQAEHLVNLHQPIQQSAQTVYEITQNLMDSLPNGGRGTQADFLVNQAYDELLRANRLIEMGTGILRTGVYPHYLPDRKYSADLERRSDEQKSRLDHHLRFVCLRDTGDLESRRGAAQAAIDNMLGVYKFRDVLFYLLEVRRLSSSERRLADGIVELSIDYVEAIAGVVRPLTRIVP